MAYLRYSRTSDWYVFEQDNGRLAVWHKDHRREGVDYSAAEIREMLARRNYSRVPGYDDSHEAQLTNAFEEWLSELAQARDDAN